MRVRRVSKRRFESLRLAGSHRAAGLGRPAASPPKRRGSTLISAVTFETRSRLNALVCESMGNLANEKTVSAVCQNINPPARRLRPQCICFEALCFA
jgi:hypothetical protein